MDAPLLLAVAVLLFMIVDGRTKSFARKPYTDVLTFVSMVLVIVTVAMRHAPGR